MEFSQSWSIETTSDDDTGTKWVKGMLAPAGQELPRDAMVEEALKSGWETYLLGVPLIALLLIGVFRLDELILKPKKKPSRLPLPLPPGVVEREGPEILSDPDGPPRRRRGRYWRES